MSSALNYSQDFLSDQAIIDNFKNRFGDIRINSLEDFTDEVFENLKKFFLSYEQDHRRHIYIVLKNKGIIKNRFKHSEDETINEFDCLRKKSQEDAIIELQSTLEKMNIEKYDVSLHKLHGQLDIRSEQRLMEHVEKFPELENISYDEFYKMNDLVKKIYDLMHLKHFIELFYNYAQDKQEKLLKTHIYVPAKNHVRELENDVIFADENDGGHALAQQLDIYITYSLSQYTKDNLEKNNKNINSKIQKLIKQMQTKDPFTKQENEEFKIVQKLDQLTQKLIKQTHKGPKVSKEISNLSQSSLTNFETRTKSKYLVEAKDYEKLYMKYKAKYLELKKQLNM